MQRIPVPTYLARAVALQNWLADEQLCHGLACYFVPKNSACSQHTVAKHSSHDSCQNCHTAETRA